MGNSVSCIVFFLLLMFSYSYAMRYIAKVLKDTLHEKFPDSSEDDLLKVRCESFHVVFTVTRLPGCGAAFSMDDISS